MDPISLATVTSTVTLLGSEAAKGVASSAGKDLWTRVKGRLGFEQEPKPAELAAAIARQLSENENTAREVVELLQTHASANPSAALLIGNVNAEKLVIISQQTIEGDFTLNV